MSSSSFGNHEARKHISGSRFLAAIENLIMRRGTEPKNPQKLTGKSLTWVRSVSAAITEMAGLERSGSIDSSRNWAVSVSLWPIVKKLLRAI